MSTFYLIMAGAFVIIGLSTVSSVCVGRVCPIPSTPNVIKNIIEYIKKYDHDGGMIADIGSGYGFLLFRLAKAFPTRKIVGYEISLAPYVVSSIIRFVFRYKNVEIVFGNAFKNIEKSGVKPSSAVVYLCSLKKVIQKLENVAINHVEGVLIVNSYALTNLAPIEESESLDIFGSKLFVYRTKNKN